MKKELNVGLIGHKFMGKAHSNALRDLGMFFDPGAKPVMKVICGVENDIGEAAQRYGWESYETDWLKVVRNPDIDIIDISSAGFTHADIAVEAARQGKHIICEKPLANTLQEAKKMYEAVAGQGVKAAVNFIYRRVPAVVLAKKIVESGKLGRIYHFRASYQQEWAGLPGTPFLWRFDKIKAGAGSMADKGAHIIDLARFLVGEITSVAGAGDIVIKERESVGDPNTRQTVTTDDVAMFITRFENGALGLFETSRIAIGHKNALEFEINGSKGCIQFNLERLNELSVYFLEDDRTTQGFRNILVTESDHAYMDKWWPAGHIIGWEHLFIHQYYEFIRNIVEDTEPSPNFYDGLKTQQVIECVERAAEQRKWVSIDSL